MSTKPTSNKASDLKDIFVRHLSRHYRFNDVFVKETHEETEAKRKARRLRPGFRIFLTLLSALPYLCLGGFIFSFWDPFAGKTAEVFGIGLKFDNLLRMISVSGLIGFATNWIAIQMLFKPLERRPIWGQGLIPAQRNRIIFKLSQGMHKHILSEELIKKRIQESGLVSRLNNIAIDGTRGLLEDKGFFRELKVFVGDYLMDYLSREKVREEFVQTIDQKLESKMDSGFKGFLFKTYRRTSKEEYDLLLNNLIGEIPSTVVHAMERFETRSDVLGRWLAGKKPDMEEFMFRVILDVLDRIDIQDLLAKQMAHFDESKLEQMIRSATDEQLSYIKLLGTLLGIFGGLLIWEPIFMLPTYLVILAGLMLLDIVLFNLKKVTRKKEK